MKNIYYVYLTTNLINGKQYIGDHFINPKEKRYYLGSGKIFLKGVKKYKSQNFIKEILEWFPTRKEAYNAQEKYIIQFNTLKPNGYNISPKGGHDVPGSMSEETKRKIGKANTGKIKSPETREKIGKFHRGKPSGREGTHHTKESIELIKKNRMGITAGEKHHYYHKKRSKEDKDKISKTLMGHQISEETKNKLRNASSHVIKIQCKYCNEFFAPWTLKRHVNSKHINKFE
jgi:group I intron endonuclease